MMRKEHITYSVYHRMNIFLFTMTVCFGKGFLASKKIVSVLKNTRLGLEALNVAHEY